MDNVSTGGMIGYLVAAIGAIGALGTAAFSLVDATKAFWGGVSNVGYGALADVLKRFAAPLDRAIGKNEWRVAVRAHWINGRPRDEQKAIVKSLIRLGLAPDTAAALARHGHVDPAALERVAWKLEKGDALEVADINVLGRLDASIDAQLDAAFDRADQQYRNVSRVMAGVMSVGLSFLAMWALNYNVAGMPLDGKLALLVGLLAVPLAPIAKDLASSLSAAGQAVKATKARP